MSFKIHEQCSGCTACVAACPTGAIFGEREHLHVIDPARCIDCGACGASCPDEAVMDHLGDLFSLFEPVPRARAMVDIGRCIGCGWCQSACPFDALQTVTVMSIEGRRLRFAAALEERCVACHACEIECPVEAIRVFRGGDPAADVVRVRNELFLDACGVTGEALPRESM